MANKKNVSNQFSAYILNYTLSSSSVGYRIPLLWSPTSMSESISATFDQQAIGGRSAPIITYSNTGARQVSLAFTVTSDYIPASGSFTSLDQYIRALKALVYPSYSGSIVNSPNCLLHLPNLEINGVCSSVNIDYKTDRYTRDGKTAAEISLTFIEVLDTVKGSINIINNSEYVATNEDYEKFASEASTSEEQVDTLSFTLNGVGQTQESPYTNASSFYYVTTGTEYLNMKVTEVYASNGILQLIVNQCNRGEDISSVRYEICTGRRDAGLSYTIDVANDRAISAFKTFFNSSSLKAMLLYYEKAPVATLVIKYIPKDTSGNEVNSSIRYRYLNISRRDGD